MKFVNLLVPFFFVFPLINAQGLYFMLGSTRYDDGESVLITDIGPQPEPRSNAGSTLACVTSDVNTHCCRGGDNPNGGAIAAFWLDPNNNPIPAPYAVGSNANIFAAYRYTHQLRLASVGTPTGPLGEYTCQVPYMSRSGIISAKIIIVYQPGLYFMLGGIKYNPGDTVFIGDIGEQPHDFTDPGSTLVCVTSDVNTHCCRQDDNLNGGPIGAVWLDPNKNEIRDPEFNGSHTNILLTILYRHQIRLASIGNPTKPLGKYTCQVPDTSESGIVSAKINIVAPAAARAGSHAIKIHDCHDANVKNKISQDIRLLIRNIFNTKLYGRVNIYPANSCKEIQELYDNIGSGNYWIALRNKTSVLTYCDI